MNDPRNYDQITARLEAWAAQRRDATTLFGVDRDAPANRFERPLPPEPTLRERARLLARKVLLGTGFWLIKKGGPL